MVTSKCSEWLLHRECAARYCLTAHGGCEKRVVSIRRAVVKCHRGCARGKVGWSEIHTHTLVVELHTVEWVKVDCEWQTLGVQSVRLNGE